MMLGEIDSALSILERLRSWGTRRNTTEETVASRFVRIFEAHGVHRNQIPRVFGHELTLASVIDDESLLAKLTVDMLDSVAQLFAIRREWIEGASEQIYPLHDFYKRPELFVEFIDDLRSRHTDGIVGVLLVGNTNCQEEDALIVLEETIGAVGEKSLYRYHLCNNWIYTYWKARADLAAIAAAAWKRKIYLLGRTVPIDRIRDYREGRTFLEFEFDSALPTQGTHWYPEDMALHPESFLDGLDEGSYGSNEGLRLWLNLESSGFMDTGLPYVGVRGAFERALAEVDHACPRR